LLQKKLPTQVQALGLGLVVSQRKVGHEEVDMRALTMSGRRRRSSVAVEKAISGDWRALVHRPVFRPALFAAWEWRDLDGTAREAEDDHGDAGAGR
jgi:hypothetical protein